MLVDIIKEIIASQEDIDVTGEIAGHSGLLKAAAQTQADIIVLGGTVASENDDYRENHVDKPDRRHPECSSGRYSWALTS